MSQTVGPSRWRLWPLRVLALAATCFIPVSTAFSAGSWVPLGPVPLASDASGNGTQDYHQVAGRATAVVIDPADSTGNTVYIGGAQSGIWKSTNAANAIANDVAWTPITDNQATLSIGAIAIQPGNNDAARSLILAATGEANNSGDSYFGLGILRSADGGNSWSLISTANSGTLSFTGLGGTRLAFSTANGQTSTAVAAMGASSEGLVDGAITNATRRGLYTTLDAGHSWTYDALSDPGGATDPTSATSVDYNDGASKVFRSHSLSRVLFVARWHHLDSACEPARRGGEGKLSSTGDVASAGCDCDWRERFGKSNGDKSTATVRLRRFLPDDDGICLVCRCERRRRWWESASTRDLSNYGDRYLFGHTPRCRAEHHRDTRRKLKGFAAYDDSAVNIARSLPMA